MSFSRKSSRKYAIILYILVRSISIDECYDRPMQSISYHHNRMHHLYRVIRQVRNSANQYSSSAFISINSAPYTPKVSRTGQFQPFNYHPVRSMADGQHQHRPQQQTRPVLSPNFDKSQFNEIIQVKALKIPAKKCHEYMKLLSSYVAIQSTPSLSLLPTIITHYPCCLYSCIIRKPKIKNIMDVPDDKDWKLLLLDEHIDQSSRCTKTT